MFSSRSVLTVRTHPVATGFLSSGKLAASHVFIFSVMLVSSLMAADHSLESALLMPCSTVIGSST